MYSVSRVVYRSLLDREILEGLTFWGQLNDIFVCVWGGGGGVA